MNNSQLNDLLIKQTKLRAQKREFRMLAQLLAQQFHVSQGDQLVLLLGSGDERSNVEAIAYWLAEHGHYIEHMNARKVDPLNRLHNELNKRLLAAEIGL
ncbi:MAG: hypothetical protein RPT25_16190 [Cycloclasticus sp.]|jgi:hypothetical protein